ncbi:MAG: hypothetical protein HPY83_18910 [Anaerolineae bacterium]|nr:hypothetical protein [Anaerolineae bacterium]
MRAAGEGIEEAPCKEHFFSLVAPDGDIDRLVTNGPDEALTAQVAQEANDVRWRAEELHQRLKQLTGSEKCQCRKGRSQRDRLAGCSPAWFPLKVRAVQLRKTLHQVKADLLSDYLQAELRHPDAAACGPS